MRVTILRRSRAALSLLSNALPTPSRCQLQLRGFATATPPLLDGSGSGTYTLVVPELGDSVS